MRELTGAVFPKLEVAHKGGMTPVDQAIGHYIVISPVKDEEKYIEATIQSMINQTIRPTLWIIVDDGSRDGTSEILKRYSRQHDWIRVLGIERGTRREPGVGVIRAFQTGYNSIDNEDFDFVVKLDCDLDLPPDYFKQLLAKFHEDEKLGIGSGLYSEERNGSWVLAKYPHYHAVGASKMLRKKCFVDIGGLVPSRGWDTLDEIRAQAAGWRTGHFKDVTFRHLKPEGSGIGFLRTNVMYGEIYYLTGGGKLFFLLKILHRMIVSKPFLFGGLGMMQGYVKAWIAQKPRLVTKTEASAYQKQLNERMKAHARKLFPVGKWKESASGSSR